MEEVRGIIKRFRYKSPTSAFKVADFEPEDPKLGAMTTIVGPIDQSNLDMSVTLKGNWADDEKYGKQFQVISCMRNQPNNLGALKQWLTTQKGVGPKTADAIAEEFGNDLREIIEKNWAKLADVRRVSATLANQIHDGWVKDSLVREIRILLNSVDAPSTDDIARRIIYQFKSDAIARITDNPYRLTEVIGFGFKTADAIARRMGWEPQRPERVEAAMAHLLEEASKEGHSFLHRAELIDAVRKLAAIELDGKTELLPEKDASEAVDRVVARGDIVQEKVTIEGQETLLCYLQQLYDLETEAAKRIAALQSMPQIPPNNLGKILKKVEQQLDLELSSQQREAVMEALTHNVSVITGLPGTGKTSVCKALIQTALGIGLQLRVAAPTGRAAKRLQEVTGWEAATIHRTLEYIPQLQEFACNAKNPLKADMFIIDEGSMLDLKLLVDILRAVPSTCSVVFIGDTNQLPSIAAGMVLRDLISSNRVHVTVLDKIFRQAEGSMIIQNAHRIFRGETPKFPSKGTEADTYWIPVPKAVNESTGKETDSIDFVKEKLVQIYDRLQAKGYDPIEDIQVLTPMKVGPAGYLAFNETIQQIVNPSGERIEIGGKVFRMGDRVMQTQNDYELEVYNGDVGFIRLVDYEAKELEVEFSDKVINYSFDNVQNLILSYASSIHKAQGSEFKVVILLLLSHHWVMLDRNIIYTANTRAKKLAIYLASRSAIETAVQNQKVLKRNSLLALRLRVLIPKLKELAA